MNVPMSNQHLQNKRKNGSSNDYEEQILKGMVGDVIRE